MNRRVINIFQAKEIAVAEARKIMDGFSLPPSRILEEEFFENSECWLFFRNRSILMPDGCGRIFADGAYAISKFGDVLVVRDYFGNQNKITEQMNRLSDYFRKR